MAQQYFQRNPQIGKYIGPFGHVLNTFWHLDDGKTLFLVSSSIVKKDNLNTKNSSIEVFSVYVIDFFKCLKYLKN